MEENLTDRYEVGLLKDLTSPLAAADSEQIGHDGTIMLIMTCCAISLSAWSWGGGVLG